MGPQAERIGVFFHGNGYHNNNETALDGTPLPSVRGQLTADAIALVRNRIGDPEVYMLSGFPFPGHTVPMAEVDAKALQRAGIPKEKIIFTDVARTTGMEVEEAARMAKELGLTSVIHVTVDPIHPVEIRKHAKDFYPPDIKVSVRTAEDMLTRRLKTPPKNFPAHVQEEVEIYNAERDRIKEELDRWAWSKGEIFMRLYNFGKLPFILSGRGDWLVKLSEKIRPDPTQPLLGGIKQTLRRWGR